VESIISILRIIRKAGKENEESEEVELASMFAHSGNWEHGLYKTATRQQGLKMF